MIKAYNVLSEADSRCRTVTLFRDTCTADYVNIFSLSGNEANQVSCMFFLPWIVTLVVSEKGVPLLAGVEAASAEKEEGRSWCVAAKAPSSKINA